MVFSNSTFEILKSYGGDLSPVQWVHYTAWTMVFVWTLAWLCYGITTIIRYTSYGYLYMAPGHMHSTIYVFTIIGIICNSIWLFILDMIDHSYALIPIWLATVSLYVGMGISLRRLYIRGPVLQREEVAVEIWCMRMLVQNGLAAYATWCFYLALVNTNIALIDSNSLEPHISTTIILSLLLILSIALVCIDNFVLDHYSRYCFSTYLVYLLALTGSVEAITKDTSSSNWTLLSINLTVACLALLIKMAVLVWRHIRVPIWTGSGFLVTQNKNYGTIDLYREPSTRASTPEYEAEEKYY